MAEDVRRTYDDQPALPIFGEEIVWFDKEHVPEHGQAQYEAIHQERIPVDDINSLEDSLLRSALWRQYGRRTAPSSSPLSKDLLVVRATADNRLRSTATVPYGSLRLHPFSSSDTEK